MSHTATCDQDEHLHEQPPAALPVGLLDPPASLIAARARRVGSFVSLPEVRWAGMSLVAFLLALLLHAAGAPTAAAWVLFAVCYAAGGWEPALAGLNALRNKTLDVDILMIVAALIAAGIGQVLDGALLIVIFSTSGALEAVATKRTQDSVRSLLELAPPRACRLLADGSEQVVDTAELTVGDVLLVRPGERIGADGRIEAGSSDVDQATITGEPLPVPKGVGDEVFAGTLNGTGALQVRVERAAADTVVARIVALVEEASATKARTQLFIEKVEQRYSIGVVVATLLLFATPLAFGAALQPTLLRAMTFMIVASPCAVVLATMPPLLSAIANAGRHGVLVKSAVVLEQLGATGVVAFDKTGTLTQGTPQVLDVVPLPGTGTSEQTLLGVAAAVERRSEHPLGRAVVAAAHDRAVAIADVDGFASTPGRGVCGIVDGHRVTVGRPGAETTFDGPIGAIIEQLQDAGRTVVVVDRDGAPIGVLALADRVRDHARQSVTQLAALTQRPPVLLTGDNAAAASHLAGEVGIVDVRAQLLPAEKVTAVRALHAEGLRVMLVGDGVNDAPAMAAANIGVAMGRHGSDLALETADVVIVRDDLTTLPVLIDISRRARRIIVQNLAFATTVITALVLVDLIGHLPLPLGVAGHEGSTVVVGLNGLRLLAGRSWTIRCRTAPEPHGGTAAAPAQSSPEVTS